MPTRLTIIGDGQMGLVMADAFDTAGVEVTLWGPFPEALADLARTRRSPRLPGFELAERIAIETDAGAALAEADLVLDAIPVQFIRSVWERIAPQMSGADVVSVSKGIENGTLLRPSEIVHDVLRRAGRSSSRTSALPAVCALSGPTIAAELARHLPATMVAASDDDALRRRVQTLLQPTPWLRIYRHDDLPGVELAGAAKNVIALAAGMLDGIDAGDNAKSALLARGLAEIARLGAAMGARQETFFGVAGVGDLATTCYSPEGRNRTCGERLGRGETLAHILETTSSVIEGVATAQSIVALAAKMRVEMPITKAVHAVLYEGLQPRAALDMLMQREQKTEQVG